VRFFASTALWSRGTRRRHAATSSMRVRAHHSSRGGRSRREFPRRTKTRDNIGATGSFRKCSCTRTATVRTDGELVACGRKWAETVETVGAVRRGGSSGATKRDGGSRDRYRGRNRRRRRRRHRHDRCCGSRGRLHNRGRGRRHCHHRRRSRTRRGRRRRPRRRSRARRRH